MTCAGINCPAWCICVDGKCQPSPMQLNALRFRTADGRYLGGRGLGLQAMATIPTPTETFYYAPTQTEPNAQTLTACDWDWSQGLKIVRIEPRIVLDPPLMSYESEAECPVPDDATFWTKSCWSRSLTFTEMSEGIREPRQHLVSQTASSPAEGY
jgi:hypothetical protein